MLIPNHFATRYSFVSSYWILRQSRVFLSLPYVYLCIIVIFVNRCLRLDVFTCEQNFTHLSNSVILNWAVVTTYIRMFYMKVKWSNSCWCPDRPWRFQEVDAAIFEDSRHMKVVRLSVPRSRLLYTPQKIFPVLISVRGWVDPRTIARQEGLWQWKIPVTPSGMEPATLRLCMPYIQTI